MAEPVGALVARLEAEVAEFKRDLGKATAALGKSSAKMNRSLKSVRKNQKSVAGGFKLMKTAAISAGVFFAARFVGQQLKAAKTIKDTADKIGFGVEKLQEYRFAASQVGVDQKTLDLALQRFSRRVGEAAQGSGELKDTLLEYGIAVKDSSGKTRDNSEVLNTLAEAIKGAESQQERLRIAFKAFDSEGAALVVLLQQGAEGLDRMGAEARSLGIILDRSMIEKAAEAERKLDTLAFVMQSKLAIAVANNADAISTLADAFVTATTKVADFTVQAGRSIGEFFAKIRGFNDTIKITERIALANAKLTKVERELTAARAASARGITSQQAALDAADLGAAGIHATVDASRSENLTVLENRAKQLRQEIGGLDAELRAIAAGMQSLGVGGAGLGAGAGAAGVVAPGVVAPSLGAAGAGFDPAKKPTGGEGDRTALLEQAINDRLELLRNEQAERAKITGEGIAVEVRALEIANSARKALEDDFGSHVRQSRAQTAQFTLGLLQVLGSKNKAFAAASIALETLLTIKRIKQQALVASWLAFASQLVPGDPTSLARAHAARLAVLAQGTASAVLAGVTGAIRIGQTLSSGGAPAGSASNPVFTQPVAGATGAGFATDQVAPGFQGTPQVQIVFNGDVIGWDEHIQRRVVQGLRDAIQNRGVVVIPPGSRQFEEIIGAST